MKAFEETTLSKKGNALKRVFPERNDQVRSLFEKINGTKIIDQETV